MLFLEPLWVHASVSYLVACARHRLPLPDNTWSNSYLTAILVLISGVFTPVENWVLHQHTAWETTFTTNSISGNPALALAPLLHLATALISYRVSVYQLATHGVGAVVKSSMWTFSVFFVTQGMFYDTLMYSGSYEEFHAGEPKDFLSFFYTDQFRDAYLVFFAVFGPAFYYLCVSWNSGATQDDKCSFIKSLVREAVVHGAVFGAGYLVLCASGVLPPQYGVERAGYFLGMHCVFHLLLILPLCLSSTKQNQE